MDNAVCRRCLLREQFPADYQKYILSVLNRMSARERVSDEAYALRLSSCRACNQLQNGTCMSCGCLVEIRAAQKAKRCPDGKWSV